MNLETLTTPENIVEIESTEQFYQSFNNSVFWDFSTDVLNYGNAWSLWEYAAFEYTHNASIYNSQDFSVSDLAELFSYASAQQWTYNTPDATGMLKAMAGRTFSSYVLQQFSHQIASGGSAEKLTLMFGSFEPMLAFFALSDLATGPSSGRFTSLPLYGSTMTFELYSNEVTPSGNDTFAFPDISSLWVRFLFRNGTDASEPLTEFSLFGRGNSEDDMQWSDFLQDMSLFSLDSITDWCNECASDNLFCSALTAEQTNSTSSSPSSSHNKGLSAAVAGVIGAIVTIALALLIAGILALVGFRLSYHPREKGPVNDLGVLKRSATGAGGFKGAEKLASDTDLTVKGAGATVIRHERVGSWELNDGANKHGSIDKDVETARGMGKAYFARRSEDGIGAVDPFGEPVKAVDQV